MEAIIEQEGPILGILAKNGAHGNVMKSYMEVNFIREVYT